MTISPTSLDRLEKLEAEATQGQWQYEPDREGSSMGWITSSDEAPHGSILFDVNGDSAQQEENAVLVCELRNHAPALIAAAREVDGMRASLAKKNAALKEAWAFVQDAQNDEDPDAAKGARAACTSIRAALADGDG